MKEWFKDWFDTVYYKALYSARNEEEADRFVEALLDKLHLPVNATILDVACGRGRYARALHDLGFDVTGIDLSFQKIRENLKYQNDRLHFFQHDMRSLFRINYFDCVVNFFTSFGYFDSQNDERNAAAAIAANVKWNGYFVIDSFNAEYVKRNLVQHERFEILNYHFEIVKTLKNDRISKKINVNDNGKEFVFYENVRLYSFSEMVSLFQQYSLRLQDSYGSYQLDPYSEMQSERMILIFKKIKNVTVSESDRS
jgi:SAM-dependent methyltransferase